MLENISLERPIAFIDAETTGTNPHTDRIVELSVFRVQPDGTEDYRSHRVNPGVPIPAETTAVHGITDADVAEEPAFSQYAKGVCEFLDGCDIAGFNVITFDLPFLEAELGRARVDFSYEGRQLVDVMVIYHQKEPPEPGKSRKLKDAYRKYCHKELEDAHSSKRDATASAEVMNSMVEKHDDLTTDVSGLCSFCKVVRKDYIDLEGKLIWVECEATFNFGMHNGRSLKEVAEEYPDYLLWILGADFRPDVCEIVKKALDGEFPQIQ
ncbi:exonuclease domain-containing protein [Chloroflexota bacterium]